ncbi:phosphoribosylanthranilate isomerase [Wukongibacter baidiensis]|uniref:phosphoribosylanthranilate isomerase n=1 Tax=Wukongibacter baidiensis TaxID=1723361 RepID=UPI003D7FF35F
MTKVKICGLRRREDIAYVNQLKPDYVGFVFAKSKRQIDKYKAKELINDLDKSIKTVGVFLNTSVDRVRDISGFCKLDVIQLHGDETPKYCSLFDREVWKAFRIKNEDSLKEIQHYSSDGYLLDTYVKGAYGGTGDTFNWNLASKIGKEKFIILAGGLSEDNIDMAINIVRPSIVDVSSGVEIDGFKDFDKMKRFIERVRK